MFSGRKYIILCILKGKMPFKMHKNIIFFSEKKYVCIPYLKFSDLLPETPLFFYLALDGSRLCFILHVNGKMHIIFHLHLLLYIYLP